MVDYDTWSGHCNYTDCTYNSGFVSRKCGMWSAPPCMEKPESEEEEEEC